MDVNCYPASPAQPDYGTQVDLTRPRVVPHQYALVMPMAKVVNFGSMCTCHADKRGRCSTMHTCHAHERVWQKVRKCQAVRENPSKPARSIFYLYHGRILPSYVESLPQHGEEEGSVPGFQHKEKEATTPVSESRNQNLNILHQNNSVADAISRIDFRLANEPGFIIDSEFQRCLRFEAIPEPGRATFVAILDDFWGQLFDLEGNLTKKAKLIRLDALLGLDVQLGLEYSRYFNISMRPDFARPVQPSTPIMPNTNNSAYSELRNLVINSFLYEERRNLDDDTVVTLVIRAHQQQNTSPPNNVIQRGLVYEMIRPFVDNNPIWAFSPSERDSARISGFFSSKESKLLVLYSFGACIRKLLNSDGSLFLFSCHYSYEEGLIGLLASRVQQFCWRVGSVPNCERGCIWQGDLIVCFGAWCINRLFELLLVETCTEIWLRCTSLLNRLRGIIELAYLVDQPPLLHCFCFDLVDSVSMGLESVSTYETGGTVFKCKYTARKMARDIYNRITCCSLTNFEYEDVVRINVAVGLLYVLDCYNKELS